ncbi:hypothetical protein BRADI_4g11630v3 [Brachypodium distachyon]|uniref:FAR1 domain-containing protein n=1 Tax=Brachypodium distachyon TaxID=15368 RepID=I1IJT9_BRADI|nr:hypothetical protein BRADI_4g11630v3 [Brachypodium distachyon]
MVDESIDEYLDIVERTFGNEDDGFEFYNSYALEKGFSVRISYVEWDEANEEKILRKFVCSREGSREKHMKREDRKWRKMNYAAYMTRVEVDEIL